MFSFALGVYGSSFATRGRKVLDCPHAYRSIISVFFPSLLCRYTLRCKSIDERGKVLLEFEMEVCLIPKMEMIGM